MAYEKQSYNGLNFVTSDFFDEDDFSSSLDMDSNDDPFFADEADEGFYEDEFNEDSLTELALTCVGAPSAILGAYQKAYEMARRGN